MHILFKFEKVGGVEPITVQGNVRNILLPFSAVSEGVLIKHFMKG
jgi:hypothetical protein